MKHVLTVGLSYTGKPLKDVKIENLGLCSPQVSAKQAAFPLYEYDTIVINPASYSHFFFGSSTDFSSSKDELVSLKHANNLWDIDTIFRAGERIDELKKAIANGAAVVWCLSEPKSEKFYGYRETTIGYAAPPVAELVSKMGLEVKKGRKIIFEDCPSPFQGYFQALETSGWFLGLTDSSQTGFESIARGPDGIHLGGRIVLPRCEGWLITPPVTAESENALVLSAIALNFTPQPVENYRSIFLSHTSVDKPFVRKLRDILVERGVPMVWVDEAEIQLGDSLTAKIEEGLEHCQYVGVILSPQSINSAWVKQELEIAITKQLDRNSVVVLPLLLENCNVPAFLKGKLYADFTEPDKFEESLNKLLQRLRK
ncbi:toll/interleukin-1 receptor domain-containing protein [bacterium]|nr:toll/interleukin-1 receptor domain-containing protein [bacterium]MBP9806838.1 toll/interleukin-1 receptor domain-containing protein [bacterium]